MKRSWGVVGIVAGLGIGVAVGPTLFADEASGKSDGAAPTEVVEPLQVGIPKDTKFVEIEPARAFDSRQPAYSGSGLFAPNSSKAIYVGDGHSGGGAITKRNIVPAGATAIAYNVTVTGATGPNFLAVTPGDATSFTASALNFNGSSDVANAGIVSIDAARKIRVWNGDQSGSTYVIVDITGYFVKPLYVQVNSNGTLRNGSRALTVTRVKAGDYKIKFDRDVIDCGKAGMIGQWEGTQDSAVIDFVTRNAEPTTVRVFTQNNDGTNQLEDRAFSLVLNC